MSTGVLVMAHGTPASLDEVAPFYTRIRRGRPPTEDQLAELLGRYRAIGGASPLAARTRAQVDGLVEALAAAEPGRYEVRFGAKRTEPSIEQAAEELAAVPGLDRVVGLVLTPHYSAMGTGEYLERAATALAGGPPFVPVRQWYDAPGLAGLLACRVQDALAALPRGAALSGAAPGARPDHASGAQPEGAPGTQPEGASGAQPEAAGVQPEAAGVQPEAAGVQPVTVLFTAHSLPERIRATGDPYELQVADSAAQVVAAARSLGAGGTDAGGAATSGPGGSAGAGDADLGGADGTSGPGNPAGASGTGDLGRASSPAGNWDWQVAWQSAGRTPEPWIGPDVAEVIGQLAARGAGGVVVCPIGFVSDHLEVLYDIDVHATEVARAAGLPLVRTTSLNADPGFLRILAGVVRRAAEAPLPAEPPRTRHP